MNLFASFILRALSILIKDALVDANIASQDLSSDQEQGFPRASMPPVEMLVNNEVSADPKVQDMLCNCSSLSGYAAGGSVTQVSQVHSWLKSLSTLFFPVAEKFPSIVIVPQTFSVRFYQL